MKIGIVGGTGKEGSGLALRLARAGHAIVIGSRDEERARVKAAELAAASGGDVVGTSNQEAASRGEIVVVAGPLVGACALLAQPAPPLASENVLDTPGC